MDFIRRYRFHSLLIFLIVILGSEGVILIKSHSQGNHLFNGQRAFQDIQYQISLGPRTPNSLSHSQVIVWIQEQLNQAGWQSQVQESESMGNPIHNIIARRENHAGEPWIILGAHYDCRLVADHDLDLQNRDQPVPGANDGASGVAVLLELARVLPIDSTKNIWLVFFDAEDQGNLLGWDPLLGSRAFVASLVGKPDSVVILDMIGDADLNIKIEKFSDAALSKEIWQQAKDLGYSHSFIAQSGYSILDDHIPFLQAGIRAVDLIDFDYPYWHTTKDTLNKVSARSLQIVGETILTWLARP